MGESLQHGHIKLPVKPAKIRRIVSQKGATLTGSPDQLLRIAHLGQSGFGGGRYIHTSVAQGADERTGFRVFIEVEPKLHHAVVDTDAAVAKAARSSAR